MSTQRTGRTATAAVVVAVLALLSGLAPLTGPADARPAATAASSPTGPDGSLATQTVDVSLAGSAKDAGGAVSVPLDAGTTMVGATWQGTPGARFAVRSHGPDGWSQWTTVEDEDGEAPDTADEPGNGRHGAGPLWLGEQGADALQVRTTGPAPASLRLLGMRWVAGADGATRAAAPRAATTFGQPSIMGRDRWAPGGWKYSTPGCEKGPTLNSGLEFAVVHHTVSSNSYSAAQVPGILASIYEFHTNTSSGRGWCDIGYNFLIDRFGTIWQGRTGELTQFVRGGHAQGFNTNSVGVSMLGQFQPGDSPAAAGLNDAQRNALVDLISWKFRLGGIDTANPVTVISQGSSSIPEGKAVTLARIVGHRDVGYTTCPGDNVYSYLPSLRQAVYARNQALLPPGHWAPFTSVGGLERRQFTDFLGRDPAGQEGVTFLARLAGYLDPPGRVIQEQLAGSDLVDSQMGSLVRLYLAFFQRIPDHAGLRYWIDLRRFGIPIEDVVRAFAATPEFSQATQDMDEATFVSWAYSSVLDRQPDAGGAAYWTGLLQAGTVDRPTVVRLFSDSAENRFVRAFRVWVIDAYTAMLDRSPSPAEVDYWAGRMNGGLWASDFISSIIGSPEYVARLRAVGG